jgi:hypothetical protein
MYASIASGGSTVWACAGISTYAARAPLARISLGLAKVRGMRAQLAQLKEARGRADAEDLSGEAEQ